MGESKHKKLITWIVVPLAITVALIIVNWYVTVALVDWLRYIVVFLLAWGLYIGSALSRGAKLSREIFLMNAAFAAIYTFGLVLTVASFITGNHQLFFSTPDVIHGMNLDVLAAYVAVLLVLDLLAIVLTRKR